MSCDNSTDDQIDLDMLLLSTLTQTVNGSTLSSSGSDYNSTYCLPGMPLQSTVLSTVHCLVADVETEITPIAELDCNVLDSDRYLPTADDPIDLDLLFSSGNANRK